MRDRALSNYTEAVILKRLVCPWSWSLEHGKAISVCSYPHLPVPHFPILYLSLCLQERGVNKESSNPDIMTTWQGTAPAVHVCSCVCACVVWPSSWCLESDFYLLMVRSIAASLRLLSLYRVKTRFDTGVLSKLDPPLFASQAGKGWWKRLLACPQKSIKRRNYCLSFFLLLS